MILFALLGIVLADTDGPFNFNGFSGYSGEILINPLTGSSMFYWMFSAVNGNISSDSRPLVIWTAGGPGYASEIGLFVEGIAPFKLDSDGKVVQNPATWALNCHILAIDFPYGSGFSYASQTSDYQNTTSGVLPYLYQFLQRIGKKYPSWYKRDVYWFGEDYSGHFVPAIANYILEENALSGNIYIPLKGIALGNPWSDGYYQTQFYDQFAYNLGLVNSRQQRTLQTGQSQIQSYIISGDYTDAFNTWLFNFGMFESYTNNANPYDMRYYSNVSFPVLTDFLNNPAVKSTFGVPPGATWKMFNDEVYESFGYDFMQGMATHLMPGLLGNLSVMIYHGQDDLYCTINGVNYWVSNWDWDLLSNFQASRRGNWMVQGNIAGYVQTYSNFTFVNVLDAGNWVGWGQPYAFRDLAYRFIFNQGWN